MSKESFKMFARQHPGLASRVLDGSVTWQKLYELYDIYGESSNIWDKFLTSGNEIQEVKPLKDTTVGDIFRTIKNVDLTSVQKGIENIEKTIGLIENLGTDNKTNITNSYEARPMYKYFED